MRQRSVTPGQVMETVGPCTVANGAISPRLSVIMQAAVRLPSASWQSISIAAGSPACNRWPSAPLTRMSTMSSCEVEGIGGIEELADVASVVWFVALRLRRMGSAGKAVVGVDRRHWVSGDDRLAAIEEHDPIT